LGRPSQNLKVHFNRLHVTWIVSKCIQFKNDDEPPLITDSTNSITPPTNRRVRSSFTHQSTETINTPKAAKLSINEIDRFRYTTQMFSTKQK
jgi:hypothetical protein